MLKYALTWIFTRVPLVYTFADYQQTGVGTDKGLPTNMTTRFTQLEFEPFSVSNYQSF